MSEQIETVIDKSVKSVDEHESIDRVSQLLSQDNLVVVVDKKGRPLGVVTRIDLIQHYV